MTSAFWIAWRELSGRMDRLILSIALFAALMALGTATEMISKSREVSLGAEIDQIGPALQLVPASVTQTELSRLDVRERISSVDEAELRDFLSGTARAIELRLIESEVIDGQTVPMIGTGELPDLDLGPGRLVMGTVASERLSKRTGDRVLIRGRELTISGILPSTGTSDDLALFLNRQDLSQWVHAGGMNGGFNEVRVHLYPGRDARVTGEKLRSRFSGLNVLVNDRGAVADRDANDSVRKHRFAVYVVLLFVILLSLFFAAVLNVRERSGEMMTLLGIGGTKTLLFMTLLWRNLIVILVSGVLGYVIAIGASLTQGVALSFLLLESWSLLLGVLLASSLVAVLATLPLLLMLRDWRYD